MYWLSRPPVVRYALATAVVLTALWMEIRPTNTVMHPFAVGPIAVGATVSADLVEYRAVPAGLLPRVSLPQFADRDVRAGDPILTASRQPVVPSDWWALELPGPPGVSPGSPVRLVMTSFDQSPVSTIGVVVDTGEAFGEPTVLVAVAEEWADTVASSAREDRVTVLVGGRSTGPGSASASGYVGSGGG